VRRVIIKLSGEALGNNSNKFDDNIILNIAGQIKKILELKTQIGIVIGGGNFWRGRSADSCINKVKSDQIGMLATVMNALYVSDIFSRIDIKTKIMTPFVMGNISELYKYNLAIKNLNKNYVLIFAGGIGHPFFSTDTVTALRARELEADYVLYAKNIDGIYDSDPDINSNAKKYKTISYQEIIARNLHAIDISAISISKNITSIVFGLNKSKSIINALDDKNYSYGTLVKENIITSFY